MASFPFWRYFLLGEIPFNGNYLVSTYHPFKTETLKKFPRGLPSKPYFDDQLRQYLPYLEFTRQSFLKGQFPFWNPYNFSGVPFFANWQTAVLFPTNPLLFFLPTADYWAFTRVLPFFLSLVFSYLFFRSLLFKRTTSILGAVLFTFSGTFISYSQETIYNNFIMAFLPLSLLAIEKYIRFSKKSYLVILFIALTFSILAGFIQQSFYLLVLVFCYAIFRAHPRKAAISVLVFAISIIITLPFLLAGFAFYQQSARVAIDYTAKIKQYLLPNYSLFTYLFPDYLGNPGTHNWFGFTVGAYHEKALWIGSIFFPFVFYAVTNMKRQCRIKIFMLFVFAVSALLVFRNPLSFLVADWRLPLTGTAMFNRLIFINTFSLTLLTALGIDDIIEKQNIGKIVVSLVVYLLLILMAATYAQTTQNHDFLQPFGAANRQVALNNMILPGAIGLTGFFLIIAFTVWRKTWLMLPLVGLVIGQGYYEFNKYTPFSVRANFYPNHPLITYLKKQIKNERERVIFLDKEMEYHWNNLATFYQIPAVSGYDPFNFKEYNDMFFYLDHPRTEMNTNRYDVGLKNLVDNFAAKIRLLQKLNVKYLVAVDGDIELQDEEFRKTFKKLAQFDAYSVWGWR